MKRVCVWKINYVGLTIEYRDYDKERQPSYERDVCYSPVGVHEYKGWFYVKEENCTEDKKLIIKMITKFFNDEMLFCCNALISEQ